MKWSTYFFLSLTHFGYSAIASEEASASSTTSAAEAEFTPSDVIVLTKDNFTTFMDKNEIVLTEFYAPWCGHCIALAPEYEKAATELKSINVPLAKVDCTVESSLCTEHGVDGYPTIKLFRGHESPEPYNEARKAANIINFVKISSLPAVSILESKEDYDKFIDSSEYSQIVGFYDPADSEANKTFTELANKFRGSRVLGAVHSPKLAKTIGVKTPGIVFRTAAPVVTHVYEEEFTTEPIAKFIAVYSLPLVGDVHPETYQSFLAANLPIGYLFNDKPEDAEKYVEVLKPVAEKYRGKFVFVLIDAVRYGKHATTLNIPEEKWPAFAVHDFTSDPNKKYPMDITLPVSEIANFMDDIVSGKIKPSIRSEDPPTEQTGPVTVVVAKTFDEIVKDSSKDVLIEYYAPWCGHCKAFAPKYEMLGELFKDHANKVVIAKLNAEANDAPDTIVSYPTIKLYPAGDKSNSIDYGSQPRNLKTLATFIRDNGSHKIDIVDKVPEEEPKLEAAETTSATSSETASATQDVKSHDEL